MRLRSALIAATALAIPAAATAQPIQGLYVGAGVGAALPQSVNAALIPSVLGGGGHLRWDEKLGFDVTGSVGYALGDGWRFEVEGDYLRNGIQELARTSTPTAASGHQRTYGLMVNALYDFDIRSRYVFPYLGVGAGYMWSRLDSAGLSGAEPGGPFAIGFGGNPGRFAWQLIAGSAFPIPNMPGLSLTAQYRLLDLTSGERFSYAGLGTTGTLKLGPQFSHTFLVGLRYAFNVAPPAPPPAAAPQPVAAPAPAPARTYLVFFDWDKATLTERAREVVHQAAENASRVQYTRIEVNGYTDTSGNPAYNRRLSIRRAQSVAAELVRDGVPRASIAIRGFGQTHLLVPTGPGVREPQNRRVEIVIT